MQYKHNKAASKLYHLQWRHAPDELYGELWGDALVVDIRDWKTTKTDHTGRAPAVVEDVYRRYERKINQVIVHIAGQAINRSEFHIVVLDGAGVVNSVAVAELIYAAAALNPDLVECDEIDQQCAFYWHCAKCSRAMAWDNEAFCPQCGDLEAFPKSVPR